MIKEIKRIFNNKLFFGIIIFCLVFFFMFICYYNANGVKIAGLDIDKYQDKAELKNIIESVNEKINLDNDNEVYKEQLVIYNYLYDNEIAFEDTKNIRASYIYQYGKDRFDYTTFGFLFNEFMFFFLSIVIVNFVIKKDFKNGFYKMLYTMNARKEIVFNKISTIFLLVNIGYMIFSVFLLISSVVYKLNFNKILIINSGSCTLLNTELYMILMFISSYIAILQMLTMFISIALIVNSVESFYFISIILLLLYVTFLQLSIYPVNVFLSELIGYFTLNVSNSIFLVLFIIKTLSIISLFYFSVNYFLRKDLIN